MNRYITTEIIDKAYRSGACKPAISWLRRKPRTWLDLIEKSPAWSYWAHGMAPQTALKVYAKTMSAAYRAFVKKTYPAREVRRKAIAIASKKLKESGESDIAWKTYSNALSAAYGKCKKTNALALKAYNEVWATALEKLMTASLGKQRKRQLRH